jgi:hypothetical protein
VMVTAFFAYKNLYFALMKKIYPDQDIWSLQNLKNLCLSVVRFIFLFKKLPPIPRPESISRP